jgi:hypothetical protein
MSSHVTALLRRLPPLTVPVTQGERLPRFYGLAWVRHEADYAVAMPIPLNVAVFWAREAWWWLKRGGCRIPQSTGEAYIRGRLDGIAYERRAWVRMLGEPR